MTEKTVIGGGLLAFIILSFFCISYHVPQYTTTETFPPAPPPAAIPQPPPPAATDAPPPPAVTTTVPSSPETPLTAELSPSPPPEQELQSKIIEFPWDSDELTAEGRATLDALVPLLQSDPQVCIDITGHTDSNGPASYNLDLSQRRAQAVRSYLISKGIGATRLTAHGDGASHPIASNTTKEGRQRNRRTEILVRHIASDGR